jgi:hypothetical protein
VTHQIKRYGTSCAEREDGCFVKYEDYAALIDRCAAIAECYDLGTIEGHEIAGLIRALKEQS